MNIAICSFAYRHADLLARMIHSIGSAAPGDRHQLYIGQHSVQPDILATLDRLERQHDMHIFRWGFNRGLARGINDLLLESFSRGADVVVYANDDIIWAPGDVHRLAREATLQRATAYAVSASGYSGADIEPIDLWMSALAFNPIALDRIGMFDENFYPAYHEDVDYDLRATKLGLLRPCCRETHLVHAGSATVASYDADALASHHVGFGRNREYFVRKWGGEYRDGKPIYDHPFNDATLGLHIAQANRSAPYGPAYDRVDLGEVAIPV